VPKLTLPAAEPSQFQVVALTTGLRYLVLSDVHLPYHDAGALLAACEYGEAAGCNAILLLGDILDCYSLSHYERDPRARSFASELEAMGQFIDYLKYVFTPKQFYWKLGNHEHRYHRYMMQHAPELVGVPQFGWASFLALDRRKVTLVAENHVLRCGQLALLHGHEWGGGSSVADPARVAFLRTMSCTISGHLHRSGNHNKQPLIGGLIANWSLGCLCDLHPPYATLNGWNHGFGILDTSKSWTVRNLRIVDGEVME
jgi:predicted phosphodiesterase